MSKQEGPTGPRETEGVGAPGEPEGAGPRDFVPRGQRRGTARTRTHKTPSVREYTGEQRLMLLDTWQRSELPAVEFSHLVGVSPHTLSTWKRRYESEGPAGSYLQKERYAPRSTANLLGRYRDDRQLGSRSRARFPDSDALRLDDPKGSFKLVGP